mgnify:CR=1 FL=1
MKGYRLFLFLLFHLSCLVGQETKELNLSVPDFTKPMIRFIRVYGEKSELEPPVIVVSDERTAVPTGLKSDKVVIEFDVASKVPPNLFARFIHCSFDWKEDENIFINEATAYRTSNIFWESAPISSKYYNFRGKIIVPNEQVKFKFSGNWKVKLYDYSEPEVALAEARFFVINPIANVQMRFYSSFYKPERNVTASAYDIEVLVTASSRAKLIENYLHTVVLYRNHRWFEPFVISMNNPTTDYFRYKFTVSIFGFVSNGKVFRIEGVPAENGYRVIDLTNLALFPSMNAPVRLPLSDIRRRGSFFEPHDDGAMVTRFVSPGYDDYVYIEFILDPEGWETNEEVFLVGSFNNWKPTREWRMYYDETERIFKLRQWVRRARHNYLYATGRLGDDGNVIRVSYDEFEGNTVTSSQTFLSFVYYRNPGYGGYDEIVGFNIGTYFTSGR